MALSIGDPAPSFELQNSNPIQGEASMNLEQARRKNGLIVVFECNHCPYVIASISRLEAMAGKAKNLEIGFIGINSNDPTTYPNDSFEHMQTRAQGMSYPYLHDVTQDVAHAYDAERTPEFFLFNSELQLIYKGRMDDSPRDPTLVQSSELDDAIQAMLDGNTPAVSMTESIGCSVKWKR
tara:strand:- start:1791 stop:2330 length:540 start_codon:yes stop_codon:yes gene_type:complete